MQKNQIIEKVVFIVVQMKSLAIHITNKNVCIYLWQYIY